MCSHFGFSFDWIWPPMLVPPNHLPHATPLTVHLYSTFVQQCSVIVEKFGKLFVLCTISVHVHVRFTGTVAEYFVCVENKSTQYSNSNMYTCDVNFYLLYIFNCAPPPFYEYESPDAYVHEYLQNCTSRFESLVEQPRKVSSKLT